MKLIITQPELEAIVRQHVLSTVAMRDGSSDIRIDFTATRGDDGITATIDIPYIDVSGLALETANAGQVPAPVVDKPSPIKRPSAQSSDSPFIANAPAEEPASTEAKAGLFDPS